MKIFGKAFPLFVLIVASFVLISCKGTGANTTPFSIQFQNFSTTTLYFEVGTDDGETISPIIQSGAVSSGTTTGFYTGTPGTYYIYIFSSPSTVLGRTDRSFTLSGGTNYWFGFNGTVYAGPTIVE